ncbi:hypothetical protein LTR17_023314 [Elasticomyces elasticus]|nr:hypothetical protein LTR17_023314 [Elasticomyces elasticus]
MATNNAIGFLDLPPEIRSVIYGLALRLEKPLQLNGRLGSPPSVVNYVYSPHLYILYGKEDEIEHVQPAHPTTPNLNVNLLQVSRQVYDEAVPILYGANTFAFSAIGRASDALLHSFLQEIGTSRKHLRHIKLLEIHNYATLRSALHLLKEAKQLDSFECSSNVLSKLTITSNVKSFIPWLKTLQKTASADPERKGALDILLINSHAEPSMVASYGQELSDGIFVERQEQQRQVMAKLAKGLA